MINLHVASINRSGASLLTRLFDGHPDVASYPVAFDYPWNPHIYPFMDKLTGSPSYIPDYDPEKDADILKFLNIPKERPETIVKWGKEKADIIGVRRNYLERELYNKVKTDFDYGKFIRLLIEYGKTAKTIRHVYEARHRAFFEAWENGKYSGTMKYVATYSSGQLFISNFDRYFKEFDGSFILSPIRDVRGYIASEKTRYAKAYYGSRRFAYPKFPNVLIRTFKQYDLDAQVRSWQVAITRMVILQERLGTDKNFIVCRYENLLNDTEGVMRALCQKTGLQYSKSLLIPTIAGQSWGGSSHQGKQNGVNKELANYYPKVLSKDEITKIDKVCGPVTQFLESIKSTPADLTKIPRDILYDYKFQKKYFEDGEKIALYSALAYRDRRRVRLGPPDAWAILALIYAQYVKIFHIPRILKLKLFPGVGKQNYR